ncbi:hypothetical protein, partial [Streptococcus pseudopneumoniae]|uniref:hypothetical protein n=1 Tax=Streptococcus pseudopneumoniae TaxID=257758 RepID=UPI0019D54ADB
APALLEVPHPVYEKARDRGRLPVRRKRIPGAAGTAIQAVGVPFKQASDHIGTGGRPVADTLGLTKDPLDTGPTTPGQWLARHGAS